MFYFHVPVSGFVHGGLLVWGASLEHWINDSCQNDVTLLEGFIETWKSWVEFRSSMANQILTFCKICQWKVWKITRGSSDTGSPSVFLWLVAKLEKCQSANLNFVVKLLRGPLIFFFCCCFCLDRRRNIYIYLFLRSSGHKFLLCWKSQENIFGLSRV